MLFSWVRGHISPTEQNGYGWSCHILPYATLICALLVLPKTQNRWSHWKVAVTFLPSKLQGVQEVYCSQPCFFAQLCTDLSGSTDIEKSPAKAWSFNSVWKEMRSDKLQQWFPCFLFTSWENLICNGPSPVKISCSKPRAWTGWCARCGASERAGAEAKYSQAQIAKQKLAGQYC